MARGKLAQVVAAGAELREVEGSFEDAHALARRLAADEGLGQRQLDQPGPHRRAGLGGTRGRRAARAGRPTCSRFRTGAAGNTSAYVRGFAEADAGRPRLLSVQSAERATTVGSAIRIVAPVHREQVEAAAEVVTVADAELLEWWSAIARLEGLFCEPASAAGVAGVAQVRPEGRVVCVLTGHGLKDPEAVERL